ALSVKADWKWSALDVSRGFLEVAAAAPGKWGAAVWSPWWSEAISSLHSGIWWSPLLLQAKGQGMLSLDASHLHMACMSMHRGCTTLSTIPRGDEVLGFATCGLGVKILSSSSSSETKVLRDDFVIILLLGDMPRTEEGFLNGAAS
ncbi:hypothetical protein GOODEAATRI_016703, partial [Goodea atripinnis]